MTTTDETATRIEIRGRMPFDPAPRSDAPRCGQCAHAPHTGRCNTPMSDAMGDGSGGFCRCVADGTAR